MAIVIVSLYVFVVFDVILNIVSLALDFKKKHENEDKNDENKK